MLEIDQNYSQNIAEWLSEYTATLIRLSYEENK